MLDTFAAYSLYRSMSQYPQTLMLIVATHYRTGDLWDNKNAAVGSDNLRSETTG
jgi:hypothetical protein